MLRVLPVVLILLLVACSKPKPPASESPTKTDTAAPAGAPPKTEPPPAGATPSPPAPGAPDPAPAAAFIKPVPAELPAVVARINGDTVTKADFQRAISAIEMQNRAPVPTDQRDRILRGLLDQMIAFKLLVQESHTRKVAVTDADVDARMAQIRQRFPSEEAFKSEMSSQKVTLDQVRNDQREQLMVQKLLKTEVDPKVAVTPADIERAYKENPSSFEIPERVRASHVLITVAPNADAAAKAEALAKATAVLKSAKAGKDFAALAKEFSQDFGSAAQGGDLGFFAAAQMVPPFSEAAFKLKPGQISEIVETQFGYHVIKVIDKQAGRKVPLEEAREQIEKRLAEMNRERQTQVFVQALRQKGKVEVFI